MGVAAALVGNLLLVLYIAKLMRIVLSGCTLPVVVKMEYVIGIHFTREREYLAPMGHLAEPGATSIPDLPQVRQLQKLRQQPILMIRILTPLAKKVKDNLVMDQTGRLVALMELVAAVLVGHLLLLAMQRRILTIDLPQVQLLRKLRQQRILMIRVMTQQ